VVSHLVLAVSDFQPDESFVLEVRTVACFRYDVSEPFEFVFDKARRLLFGIFDFVDFVGLVLE
jgi:hypothetical protein